MHARSDGSGKVFDLSYVDVRTWKHNKRLIHTTWFEGRGRGVCRLVGEEEGCWIMVYSDLVLQLLLQLVSPGALYTCRRLDLHRVG